MLGFSIKDKVDSWISSKTIIILSFLKSEGETPSIFLKKSAERLDVFVAYFVSDFFDTLVRVA
jgi:hypothetical protein